jgi:hypothetical protein
MEIGCLLIFLVSKIDRLLINENIKQEKFQINVLEILRDAPLGWYQH